MGRKRQYATAWGDGPVIPIKRLLKESKIQRHDVPESAKSSRSSTPFFAAIRLKSEVNSRSIPWDFWQYSLFYLYSWYGQFSWVLGWGKILHEEEVWESWVSQSAVAGVER